MKRLTLAICAAAAAMLMSAQSQKLTGTPMGSPGWNYELGRGVDAAANAFDGDLQTYYASEARSYTWVGLDLGSPHVITRVGWSPRNDPYNGEKRVVLGMIQGANRADWLDAMPIYMITEKGVIGQMHYGEVEMSKGFRYVRYVGPTDARCNIGELEFYGMEDAGDDSHLFKFTNLPMVLINTVDSQEPYDKEHEITSNVIIVDENGKINIDKPAGVRERGNNSRSHPKKPWRIKFEKKQQPLDAVAQGKKWTLINSYDDKSLMRNALAFEIARRMGMEYVPWCRLVEVVLNGEYKGVYQLCDQIDVRPGRVDIDEMTTDDIAGDALTGGYLLEVDGYANQEPAGEWFETDRRLPITIKSPDDGGTPEQYAYIKKYINDLHNLVFSADFDNPASGYRSILDIDTFVKHILTNELSGNADECWSVYWYKKRLDPKIYTGPVWDFDHAFDNCARVYPVCEREKNGFLFNCAGMANAGGVMDSFVYRVIVYDKNTAADMKRQWSMAHNDRDLTVAGLQKFIDDKAELLSSAQRLNFMRWDILNKRVGDNPRDEVSFEIAIGNLKSYIAERLNQLDQQVGYDPNISGIASVEGDGPLQVDVINGSIGVEECSFEVYNIQGVKLFDGRGRTQALPAGFYVVKAGAKTRKVAIR